MWKLFKLTVIFALAAGAQDLLPEPAQRTDAPYRLFRTKNTFNFLRLDTRTGQIWHVQWGNEPGDRHTYPLNLVRLSDNKKPGRFTLTSTTNFYTFILSDQEDGRQWQVQWSTKPEERGVWPIADALSEQSPRSGVETSAAEAAATPKIARPSIPKGSRPIKPQFGDIDGETWGEYQQVLAKYETDFEAWLIAETRRAVQQELAAKQKQNAVKSPTPHKQ